MPLLSAIPKVVTNLFPLLKGMDSIRMIEYQWSKQVDADLLLVLLNPNPSLNIHGSPGDLITTGTPATSSTV